MRRIAFVSCVKTKAAQPSPAKDLYISPLFRGMRRYAQAHAGAWFILSAEHGLLSPDQQVAPYEKTLLTMSAADRRAWSDRVLAQMDAAVSPRPDAIIVLAGLVYRAPIQSWAARHGIALEIPMEGLPFGEQLRWLRQHAPNRS